jgi:predicted nucleotidyltransferase
MPDRKIIDLIRSYISLLDAEGLSVYKAFLYGSYASGNQKEDSDIDLMIVSDKYSSSDDMVVGKMWQLTKRINTRIEPFLVSKNQFYTDDTSPLIESVRQNGFRIV